MPDQYDCCLFQGEPPVGYSSWRAFVLSPVKKYVVIRAAEELDFSPRFRSSEAWQDLWGEPDWEKDKVAVPPWILQALEASTGKVLSLEEVRIILKGSSISQEIIEARGVDLEPIRKVWDHYKHLDKGILGFDGDFRTHVMQDAWQAIKQVLGEK